jgi:hypothetical protein
MKAMTRIMLAAFAAVCMIIVSITTECYAFRCGKEIVSVWDTAGKVLMRCGPPTYKEQVKIDTQGTYYGTRHGGSYHEETEIVENWYYNCGEKDFVYILNFKGGILQSENTQGNGSGSSDCNGRK